MQTRICGPAVRAVATGQLRRRLAADRDRDIADRYLELLPEVTVARSPDTGEVVRWRIDTAGLDGWFWRYEASARVEPDPIPAGWLAMNGAMRLHEPVEFTAFQVIPGPGVPYVVPRLLHADGVRAVIAELPIGRHTGWPITYFGPRPPDIDLVNTWGRKEYYVYDDELRQLGYATSQLYSPILQRHVALARIPLDRPAGSTVKLEIPVSHRYVHVDAEVTSLPLFNPPRRTA